MFNLYEIIRNAHGGHALDTLATQFGITTEEADAAVKAVVPVLPEGFLKQASEPHAFGSFIGALGASGGFYRSGRRASGRDRPKGRRYSEPNPYLLQRSRGDRPAGFERDRRQPGHAGKNAPCHRFDDLRRPYESHGKSVVWRDPRATRERRRTRRSWPAARPDIGRRAGFGQPAAAASRAGSGWRAGGLGSILGQILGGGRSPGGPGQPPSAAPGPAGGGQGGLGGILASILGNLTSRPGGPGSGPAAGPAAPSGSPQLPGFDAASIQAGLEALTKMLQPGTPPPTGPQSGINAEIDQIMGGKRP
jgi:Bacterial protein of unknown function (DUF937)